jgi:hypothetical protein
MRYDYDPEKGFHVDAIKNKEHRAYIRQGEKGAAAGGGNTAYEDYRRAMNSMNDRLKTESEKDMMEAFLNGRI